MARIKTEQMAPLSVRITVEMKARLEKIAEKMGIAPHTLARLAIEAGINAAEQHGSLALPVRFEVTHVPVPVQKTGSKISYGSRSSPAVSGDQLNEEKPKKKTG